MPCKTHVPRMPLPPFLAMCMALGCGACWAARLQVPALTCAATTHDNMPHKKPGRPSSTSVQSCKLHTACWHAVHLRGWAALMGPGQAGALAECPQTCRPLSSTTRLAALGRGAVVPGSLAQPGWMHSPSSQPWPAPWPAQQTIHHCRGCLQRPYWLPFAVLLPSWPWPVTGWWHLAVEPPQAHACSSGWAQSLS